MLLQSADVAQRVGVTPDRIRQLARAGLIPFEETPGGTRLFSPAAVEEILAARRRAGRVRKTQLRKASCRER